MTRFPNRNGVSGLMRVRNEGKTIRVCVESCLPALDELIIVYQPSNDNTEDEINKLKLKYPNKIKSYKYSDPIYSHKLTREKFNEVLGYPANSPHLLATYYNFTLSKASYRYAMKIDADQIYNTSKLKKICDAYRSETKIKILLKEKVAAKILHWTANINWIIAKVLGTTRCFPIWTKKLKQSYEDYVYKKINNDKNPVNLSGINLGLKDNHIVIPMSNLKAGGYPLFNGTYDHIIFEIGPDTYYEVAPGNSSNYKYGLCIIEKFHYDQILRHKWGWDTNLLQLGFLWWHIAPLRDRIRIEKDYLLIKNLKNISFKKIERSLANFKFSYSRYWFKLFLSNYNCSKEEKRDWILNLKSIRNIDFNS